MISPERGKRKGYDVFFYSLWVSINRCMLAPGSDLKRGEEVCMVSAHDGRCGIFFGTLLGSRCKRDVFVDCNRLVALDNWNSSFHRRTAPKTERRKNKSIEMNRMISTKLPLTKELKRIKCKRTSNIKYCG